MFQSDLVFPSFVVSVVRSSAFCAFVDPPPRWLPQRSERSNRDLRNLGKGSSASPRGTLPDAGWPLLSTASEACRCGRLNVKREERGRPFEGTPASGQACARAWVPSGRYFALHRLGQDLSPMLCLCVLLNLVEAPSEPSRVLCAKTPALSSPSLRD